MGPMGRLGSSRAPSVLWALDLLALLLPLSLTDLGLPGSWGVRQTHAAFHTAGVKDPIGLGGLYHHYCNRNRNNITFVFLWRVEFGKACGQQNTVQKYKYFT